MSAATIGRGFTNYDYARCYIRCYNRHGSYSWPVLGTGFKPGVRYFVSRVGSTPTSFRQNVYISINRQCEARRSLGLCCGKA